MFSRSTDQGRTWSRAETIVDAPEVDDRNAAIVELPDRSLLVTYNTYTAVARVDGEIRSLDRRRQDLVGAGGDRHSQHANSRRGGRPS